MNITLSVPEDVAAQAKLVAASKGETLSSWFRKQVARESEEMELGRVAAGVSETAAAAGSALPLEVHWNDPRWRALAEKHLR